MSNEIYDLEAIYDEKISPLMTQIIQICQAHQMPMLCTFAYENCEDNGIGQCTTVLNDFEGRAVPQLTAAMKQLRSPSGAFAMAITVVSGEKL